MKYINYKYDGGDKDQPLILRVGPWNRPWRWFEPQSRKWIPSIRKYDRKYLTKIREDEVFLEMI